MRFLRFTFLFAFVSGLCLLSACNKGNDPKPTIEETQLKLLKSATWVVSKVTFDASSDRTSEYQSPNFTLTFAGEYDKNNPTASYNFTTANRPGSPDKSPWPATGTWKFEESSPATLIRRFTTESPVETAPDGVLITYSVTVDKLQLTFEYAGTGFSGRTNAVAGTWIFEFTPQ
jgi:hypothetical protein